MARKNDQGPKVGPGSMAPGNPRANPDMVLPKKKVGRVTKVTKRITKARKKG